MNTLGVVRADVSCSQCQADINRVIWNYGKNRPVTKFFCNNTCKAAWQRGQREALGFTREWLIDQYIVKNKSADQIAREIGRDPKRVWEWIVNYGIPTRPRGVDAGQRFQKGHQLSNGRKLSQATRDKIRTIAIATGRVPYDPKVGSYMKGRKGADTPSWKGGITPERQAFYATPEWANAVKAIWKRDNAICQRCKLDHRTIERGNPRFTIHHIDSFKVKERRADVQNLILLCQPCHYWVHSKRNIKREFLGQGH